MGRVVAALIRRAVPVLGTVLVLLGGLAVPGGAAPRPAPDLEALDRFLGSSLARTGLPGMAVVITHGPDVVVVRGFGTDSRGDAITATTPFRIASLSKSFTAVAVLQLVAAGRIDLDAAVRTYLPEFGVADPEVSRRITVRQLLNQTSGLADAGFSAVAGSPAADLSQQVAALHAARAVSEPGREFHYFDPNYQLLARMVEVVTGERFGTHLRERVFDPLGMRDTVAADTAADAARSVPALAPGHVLGYGVPIARPELDGLLAGSGGVVSTADDMASWLIMQSAAGGDGAPLLASADLTLMHTPPPGVAGGYGQGWQVVTPDTGPRRIEHNGVLSTYSAEQVLLPDSGYAFALLFNGNSALADTAGIKVGLATLLADGSMPAEIRSTRLLSVPFGLLTLGVPALRLGQLRRLGRWRARRTGRPWWGVVPGIGWLLLPTALLAGAPRLLEWIIGRSFTFWQLCLAMPELMVLLGVAAASGTAVAAGRAATLARHREPDGDRKSS